MGYIPAGALDNLKQYKYSVIDASLFSQYVLQPYWNYMIRFVPMWIAPNLITLIGTLVLLFNYFLVAYYVPRFEGAAPRWIYLSSAFAIEWYCLLDNLDGRQARRTKNSSPLGELFDHGCDSLAVAIGASTAACIYQFGSGEKAIVSLIIMSLAFWCSSWEEYHTGTFFLGYFNGPAEGLKILLCCYVWTFFFGPEFWLTDWRVLLFMPSWLADQLPAIEFREYCCYFFSVLPMVITAIFNVRSVLLHVKEKGKPVGPAVGQIFTFIIYFGMVVIWYLSSNRLWRENPHPLHMAVGVGFAEMTSGLILAHLCKMEYPMLRRPMIPLLVVTVNSLLNRYYFTTPLVREEVVMWGFLAVASFLFLHYAVTVINELCAYLHINCLTITPKKE